MNTDKKIQALETLEAEASALLDRASALGDHHLTTKVGQLYVKITNAKVICQTTKKPR
jgi:hypothetical protein